jgi:hypothetical protein
MPGLTLPSPESAPESWSPIERVGMACLRGCLAWMVRTTGRREFRGRSKVVIVPEVHLLTKTPDGASFLDYIARVGRALGASLVLDTQDPASILKLPGLVEQITTLFAFSLRSREQVDSLLELLGRPQTAPYQTLVRGINTAANGKSIRHGHCIMRDRWDEVATVQIDIPSQRVAALLRTTPESEHANAPAQPAIPTPPEDPFTEEEDFEPAATATAQSQAHTQQPTYQDTPSHNGAAPNGDSSYAGTPAMHNGSVAPYQNGSVAPHPNGVPASPNGASPAPAAPAAQRSAAEPTQPIGPSPSPAEEPAPVPVAQQNGHPPTPNGQGQDLENGHHHPQPNGHEPQPHGRTLRHDSPIGPDEVYDQEADEAAYNEAMYPAHPDDPTPDPDRPTGNKEHVA